MLRYLSALSSGTTGRPCTWSGVVAGTARDAGPCAVPAAALVDEARSTPASTSAETARKAGREIDMATEHTFEANGGGNWGRADFQCRQSPAVPRQCVFENHPAPNFPPNFPTPLTAHCRRLTLQA